MAITYYSANLILDYNFGNITYSTVFPTTMYVGLCRTDPTIAGTAANEPTGIGSYARVAIDNDKVTWGISASGALTNLIEIPFVESTDSWGTILYVGIWDALTAGNLWYYDALTPTREVAASTSIYFSPGAISISMTNA